MSFTGKYHCARAVTVPMVKDAIGLPSSYYGAVVITYEWFNASGRSLVIYNRDGTTMHMKPQLVDAKIPPGLYVTKKYTHHGNTLDMRPPHANGLGLNNDIADSWNRNVQHNYRSSMHSEQYIFSSKLLEEVGYVYADNLDVVVSVALDVYTPHPGSPDGEQLFSQENNNQELAIYRDDTGRSNTESYLHFTVQSVTPPGHHRTLFVNLFGKVREIPCIVDTKRKPGIYVLENGIVNGLRPPTSLKMTHYDFDEIYKPREGKEASSLPFRIFTSSQEAEVNGDFDREREAEWKEQELSWKEREREIKAQEQTLKERKVELETKALEIELDKRRMEIELNKMKTEVDLEGKIRDAEYKRNELEKKERESFLSKWGPVIVLGLTQLIPLIKSFFTDVSTAKKLIC